MFIPDLSAFSVSPRDFSAPPYLRREFKSSQRFSSYKPPHLEAIWRRLSRQPKSRASATARRGNPFIASNLDEDALAPEPSHDRQPDEDIAQREGQRAIPDVPKMRPPRGQDQPTPCRFSPALA